MPDILYIHTYRSWTALLDSLKHRRGLRRHLSNLPPQMRWRSKYIVVDSDARRTAKIAAPRYSSTTPAKFDGISRSVHVFFFGS